MMSAPLGPGEQRYHGNLRASELRRTVVGNDVHGRPPSAVDGLALGYTLKLVLRLASSPALRRVCLSLLAQRKTLTAQRSPH